MNIRIFLYTCVLTFFMQGVQASENSGAVCKNVTGAALMAAGFSLMCTGVLNGFNLGNEFSTVGASAERKKTIKDEIRPAVLMPIIIGTSVMITGGSLVFSACLWNKNSK